MKIFQILVRLIGILLVFRFINLLIIKKGWGLLIFFEFALLSIAPWLVFGLLFLRLYKRFSLKASVIAYCIIWVAVFALEIIFSAIEGFSLSSWPHILVQTYGGLFTASTLLFVIFSVTFSFFQNRSRSVYLTYSVFMIAAVILFWVFIDEIVMFLGFPYIYG